MLEIYSTPGIPTGKIDEPFTQTLCLKDGNRNLGRAIWAATDPGEGVIQILDLWVPPESRRSGHGGRLLQKVIDQGRALHKWHRQPLRRLWIGVGHKTQIVGRSFLTRAGFHHIGSTSGLLKDQDLLIYVKSLD